MGRLRLAVQIVVGFAVAVLGLPELGPPALGVTALAEPVPVRAAACRASVVEDWLSLGPCGADNDACATRLEDGHVLVFFATADPAGDAAPAGAAGPAGEDGGPADGAGARRVDCVPPELLANVTCDEPDPDAPWMAPLRGLCDLRAAASSGRPVRVAVIAPGRAAAPKRAPLPSHGPRLGAADSRAPSAPPQPAPRMYDPDGFVVEGMADLTAHPIRRPHRDDTAALLDSGYGRRLERPPRA